MESESVSAHEPGRHAIGSRANDQGARQSPADSRPTRVVMVEPGSAGEWPSELAEAWKQRLASSNAGADGTAFLGPDLASAIAAARPDARLIVGFDGAEPTRFLPVHLLGRGRAAALGGRFCDVHGPVGIESSSELLWMLKGAGLRSWRFRRCPATLSLSESERWTSVDSQWIGTSHGQEGLRDGAAATNSSQLKQLLRKERKLAREVGELRFEFDSNCPELLEHVLAWKRAQRIRSRSANVFDDPWAKAALSRLHGERGARRVARLSGLWAGGQLVAAHLGLSDERVLHWWIPSYDPRFGACSPGLILLLHLIRASKDFGIERIDLGHGQERYKSAFATGAVPLYGGAVASSILALRLGSVGAQFRSAVRGSSLEPGWAASKRLVRGIRYRLSSTSGGAAHPGPDGGDGL